MVKKREFNKITKKQFPYILKMCKQELKNGWEPFAWIRVGTLRNASKRIWFKFNQDNTKIIELVSWKWDTTTQELKGNVRPANKYWARMIIAMLKDPSFQLEVVTLGKETK